MHKSFNSPQGSNAFCIFSLIIHHPKKKEKINIPFFKKMLLGFRFKKKKRDSHGVVGGVVLGSHTQFDGGEPAPHVLHVGRLQHVLQVIVCLQRTTRQVNPEITPVMLINYIVN